MARFFMTEKLPMLVMSDKHPGPGWEEGRRTDAPQRRTAPSVADLAARLAIEIEKSRELRRQFADTRLTSPEPPPEETFVDIVDRLVRAGMNYGQACRESSATRPDLYAERRARSML
jgi:hypothetical protein